MRMLWLEESCESRSRTYSSSCGNTERHTIVDGPRTCAPFCVGVGDMDGLLLQGKRLVLVFIG